MGIPIGWNIAREDAKAKDVLRADVNGHRSPIRRRTRPTRSPRSQSTLDTDLLIAASRSPPRAEQLTRSPFSRARPAPPPVPEVSRSAYGSDFLRDPPSLQREDASFRQQQSRMHGYIRAIRENERPSPALTPGFAPAAALREDETEALRANAAILARVGLELQDRANARSRRMRSRSPRTSDYGALRRGGDGDASEDGHETNDSHAVGFPPLRRMGRRNIADGPLPSSSLRESWSPVSTVDGLGDRERSLSPADDNSQWNTFYGTIRPDPVGPTAESSFASGAASASFSNSHPSSRAGSSNMSASSSRTHLTVPSQRDSPSANNEFMRACESSDDDTASDTEAEEDDTAPTAEEIARQYNPITLRRRSRPSYFSDEPPHRDTERHSRRVMERARDASAYVRSFYNSETGRPRSMRGVMSSPMRTTRVARHQVDGPSLEQLDGPVDGPAPGSDEDVPPLVALHSPALDQELREARSLLERLSRREDVRDDFWASVGLTRSFADRVESFNERDRLE
jgi:hypothetical protein